MRPRSPIEQMVDRACGVPWAEAPAKAPDFVLLVCESCGAKRSDVRIPEYFDFDRIETTCPKCTESNTGASSPIKSKGSEE